MAITINGKRYDGEVGSKINKALIEAGNKHSIAFYLTKINGEVIAEHCKPEYLLRNKLWGAFLFFMLINGSWVEIK